MHRSTLLLLCALLLPASATAQPEPPAVGGWSAIDLTALPTLDAIIPRLVQKQVVYAGENHDDYATHLVQLELLKRLHAAHPDLALGVEYFQQPFQSVLDRFVAGEIDQNELLLQSEYFDRWSYDWRLYQPIFEYARAQRIPIIALNVASELHNQVAAGGIAALSEAERAGLPEIDRSDSAYREQLQTIFQQHPGAEQKSFDAFYEAQLLWDEGMAQRVAQWLTAHPTGHMLVLAGTGHLQFRAGIPNRVARRVALDDAVVLSGAVSEISSHTGDYLLLPPEVKLPPPGRLGIMMEQRAAGVFVAALDDPSPAKQAGIEQGDRLVTVAGRPITHMADVRTALWDRRPGEEIAVETERAPPSTAPSVTIYQVPLR